MNLLALLLRRSAPPRFEPVAPPREVLDAIGEDYARTQALLAEIDSAMVAVSEVPADFYIKPASATSFADTSDAVVAVEARVLARLARETARSPSPWDAAVSVFGGAAVARGAVGTGLYGSLAGRQRENVPR